MSVGEVEKLEGNSFLVRGHAEGREKHVDESGIARTFAETVVLERGKRNGRI